MITTGMTTTMVMTSTIATKTHTRRVAGVGPSCQGKGQRWLEILTIPNRFHRRFRNTENSHFRRVYDEGSVQRAGAFMRLANLY